MSNKPEQFFFGEDIVAVVNRYEDMLRNNACYYFDVSDYEAIIDFYIDNNKLDHAIKALDFGAQQHPYSTNIQLKKAQLLIDKGTPAQALPLLRQLARIEPYNTDIMITMGVAYNNMGNTVQAAEYFKKAIQLSYEEKDEVYYTIAVSYIQNQLFNIAIRYLEQTLTLNTNHLDALYDLAFCYDRIDKNIRSVQLYEKYLDEKPFNETAWFNLGTVYEKLENIEKALEAYDFALAIDPASSSALFNKANLLMDIDDYEHAIVSFHEFLENEKSDVDALCSLGECYYKLNDLNKAKFYYHKALNIDEEFAEAFYGLGIVALYEEKLDESYEFFSKAIELNESVPDYWFARAKLLMRTGKEDASRYDFDRCLLLSPDELDIWLSYIDMLELTGKGDEAANIAFRASEIFPDQPEINIRCAAYAYRSKRKVEAGRYLKQALSRDANMIEVLFSIFPQARNSNRIQKFIKTITASL